jgi:hypothetical protein
LASDQFASPDISPGQNRFVPYSNLSRRIGVKSNAMRHIARIIVLALLLSVTAAVNGQDLPVITLRRTACFGTCPGYSLEIFQDGRLHYNGEAYVAVTGPQEAQIPPEAVKALIESFLKIDYFNLEDVYETYQDPDGTRMAVTDLPTTFTSLEWAIARNR